MTKWWTFTTMVPNPRNPNTHPEKQIELLAKIIKNQGWRAPITVSSRSGFIVRGHGRLMAAQLLGVEQVPVDRQDYETEAEEWADLIADNRIAELAEMDDALLKDLLVELDAGEFDIELTGFDRKRLIS
jgi:ParB-like chromosome segregation protein Spo0J